MYDSERDIVDSHDFGEVRHFPVSHYWDPIEPKLLACETRRVRVSVVGVTRGSNLQHAKFNAIPRHRCGQGTRDGQAGGWVGGSP